ncbi:17167_t:CDS:2, partial [Dentiscutata erythropus]
VSYAGWREPTGTNLWKSPTVDLHIPRLTTSDHTNSRNTLLFVGSKM